MSSVSSRFNLGHPRFGRHGNPTRVSRVTAVANTHSNLLAGDWVGFPGTPRLFEYWWSMFRIRTHHDWTFQQFGNNGVADDPHLHGRRIGFSRFSRGSNCRSKESFYAHRRWFFSLAVAIIATSVCKHLLLDGKLPNPRISYSTDSSV